MGLILRQIPKYRFQPTQLEKDYFAELSMTEFVSAEELKKIQLEKLYKMIAHAYENVPYYKRVFKERGLKPDDISSVDKLNLLPLLTKQTIRENYDDLISKTIADRSRFREVTTGGSTGTPMKFLFDEHMIGVRRAHWWRWSKFAGVELYEDRLAYCGGAPAKWIWPPEKMRGVVNYSREQLFLSSAAMSDSVLEQYIQDIRKFKADYIRGYASGVYMIARKLNDLGETIPLKAILTSSDALYMHYRTAMEQAFQCSVFDHYGQVEDILTATECGHEAGFHVNTESCVAESVDENGMGVESEGKLVGTHLENFAMPLLRYVIGDVGYLDNSWNKCACGRSHQKIMSFNGREDEIIVTEEGRRITTSSMSYPMKTMFDYIRKGQYVQESKSHMIINVVPTKKWRDEIHTGQIIGEVRKQVGDKMGLSVKLVDDIPSRKNGKYQFIVSKIDN